jgi:hypothetical protein
MKPSITPGQPPHSVYTAASTARPARPAPMQYRANMPLLKPSRSSNASSSSLGQRRSARVMSGPSSTCRMLLGWKVSRAVRLEQCVTFLDGVDVPFVMAEGV